VCPDEPFRLYCLFHAAVSAEGVSPDAFVADQLAQYNARVAETLTLDVGGLPPPAAPPTGTTLLGAPSQGSQGSLAVSSRTLTTAAALQLKSCRGIQMIAQAIDREEASWPLKKGEPHGLAYTSAHTQGK